MLTAGDTVHIKTGTYSDRVAPSRSGTSSQRITYRNYGTDVVTISNSPTFGLYLNGNSYITIQGIDFSNQDRFLYFMNGAHHNIVAYCNFNNARLVDGLTSEWAGSRISGSSQHNWIHHCRFSNYGFYNASSKACVIDIGTETNKTDQTRYNLIENNHFYHGGHHIMGVYGMYNVIRNNYFHNEPWAMGTTASDRGVVMYGNRNLSFSGYSENGGRNLFERNRVGYSGDSADNVGSSGMSLNSSNNIVRFNSYYHNDNAGMSISLTSSSLQNIRQNKIYNNTFFNNGHNPNAYVASKTGIFIAIYSGTQVIEQNGIKNNIFYKHRLPFGEYNSNTPDNQGLLGLQICEGNWNGEIQGDPMFVNANTTFGDPMDPANPDLRLQTNTPCHDAGTYLTTITSSNGSGTSFVVGDSGYFMDGWGISEVQGDEIQLFGTLQKARIINIDYSTNTITVNSSLTWTQGQGISLAYEGTAPDVGAYEFGVSNAPSTPRNLRLVSP
jgi:hypothetical protein